MRNDSLFFLLILRHKLKIILVLFLSRRHFFRFCNRWCKEWWLFLHINHQCLIFRRLLSSFSIAPNVSQLLVVTIAILILPTQQQDLIYNWWEYSSSCSLTTSFFLLWFVLFRSNIRSKLNFLFISPTLTSNWSQIWFRVSFLYISCLVRWIKHLPSIYHV